MFQEYKKYIIAAIAAVVVIGGGIGAYVLTRPEPELPHVYEDKLEETKLTPEELAALKADEEKVHTDEYAVPLEEGALEGNPENDTPEIDKESLEIQKEAEKDFKEVYDKQQEMLESGELVIGEETDIEKGTIAKEDVLEYSGKDDVLQKVNYSTEKAISDIQKSLGDGAAEHWLIADCDEADWEQVVNNPYSSPRLSIFFDEYKQYGDLEIFKTRVAGWLQNGGDDGVAHGEVFG